MRRITKLMACTALFAIFTLSATPASADCDDSDGSVPGTSGSVMAVTAGPSTFYVDDRDWFDLDDDGQAGGIWIYEESNGQDGLQRGGMNWALDDTGVGHWRIPLGTAMHGVWQLGQQIPGTMWPEPMYYEPTVAEFLGATDSCRESATPDRLWF